MPPNGVDWWEHTIVGGQCDESGALGGLIRNPEARHALWCRQLARPWTRRRYTAAAAGAAAPAVWPSRSFVLARSGSPFAARLLPEATRSPPSGRLSYTRHKRKRRSLPNSGVVIAVNREYFRAAVGALRKRFFVRQLQLEKMQRLACKMRKCGTK